MGTHVVRMPLHATNSSFPSPSSPPRLTEAVPDTRRSLRNVAERGDLSLALEIPNDGVARVGTGREDVRDVRIPGERGDVVDGARASAGRVGFVGRGEIPDVNLRTRSVNMSGTSKPRGGRTSPLVAPEAKRLREWRLKSRPRTGPLCKS